MCARLLTEKRTISGVVIAKINTASAFNVINCNCGTKTNGNINYSEKHG